MERKAWWYGFAFVLILSLQACRGAGSPTEEYFIPPPKITATTPVETPAPGSEENSQATTTSDDVCVDNLFFLEDITIFDGTIVHPGEKLDKHWRVENSGTCNWHSGYTIRLISGQSLGAAETQALFPARSGTKIDLGILFTAPELPGTYRSAWQAYSPDEVPFGDPFYIEIIVE